VIAARSFDRPHLLALALCGGLAAATLVRLTTTLGVAAAVGGAAFVASAPAGRRAPLTAALALLLAGWWWSTQRAETLDRSVLACHVGESEWVEAVVTGPVRRGTFSLRAPAVVERFGRLSLREPVLLELPLGRAPPQGARIALAARLAEPRPADRGFDERAWLARRGVHVVAHGGRWRVIGRRGGLPGLADRLHARLARTIAPGLRGDRRAVVDGIVLGEDEALSSGLRERFQASGLYHLLAVSGANVAFLAGGVLLLARAAGVARWAAELCVLASVCGYLLAVGWQPSVVRAGVAGCLASLAWLAARPRDRWYFLLLGAIGLLAWNPYSLLEPGFQLSFAAVAAIFVAVPRLERALEGYPVPRALAGVIAVSLACGVATAPILWLEFGAVPLYTVAANALAAPVVAPLLGLGLACAALAPVLPGVALAVGSLNGWLAAYLAGCARLVGGLPHAQITSWAGLALVGGLPVIALAAARLRGAERRGLLALAAVVVMAAVGWTMVPREAPPPPRGVRITFLDVGQGDAVLIQTAAGALLVDQGPPEAQVARQLQRLGVRRLALLVLTHPQRDHVGGAADVLERLHVDLALDPGLPTDSPDEAAARREARENGVRILVARAGRTYRLGRLRIEVLWPDGPGAPGDDPNLHATVLLVSYGPLDALLTADAESEVTTRLPLRPVEILKVAHHGSADPLLPELLRRVRPRVAVISVGRNNDYHHPTGSTLAALDSAPGLEVYRTDRDGRVTIESDGRRILVRASR
jgi:competence protein ComEC